MTATPGFRRRLRAVVGAGGDEDIVGASLDTDDGTVRSWAESLHERFRSEATPLAPADLQP